MRLLLKPHPETRPMSPLVIEADISERSHGSLALSYVLVGQVDDVVIPPEETSRRSDELWHHTCFEAFFRSSLGATYYEFNFAPSRRWAAYRFDGYRSGRSAPDQIAAPSIETHARPDRYAMQVTLALAGMPDLPRGRPWRLNLSAVIEHADGHKSYWALAHPPGKPDFHHQDGFIHEFLPDQPA